MDLRFGEREEAFRAEARAFLEDRLSGPFAAIRGRGGPGDEHALFEERWAWEQELGRERWIGLSWPARHGGREASLLEQVIFYEEYARAGGPGRVGIVGEGLLGPTLVHFGSEDQQARFLPGILAGTELWCQGYSEPNAGSDLANLSTRATREGDEWVIHGQKVWTSLAHWAQWCFVLARTDPDAPKHRGISYLLVPMDQPGIEVRPIVQLTGHSEFNETFFDGARTPADHVVGEVHGGWKVAMGTLAFERGASTLGQQLEFEHELEAVVTRARQTGRDADPIVRQRIAALWSRIRVMRYHALRTLPMLERGQITPATSVHKLFWAGVHRDLGELAVDVAGAGALGRSEPAPGAAPGAASGVQSGSSRAGSGPDRYGDALDEAQRLFLWTRADTIYGGSDEIQRNVIGERALGLPREPR